MHKPKPKQRLVLPRPKLVTKTIRAPQETWRIIFKLAALNDASINKTVIAAALKAAEREGLT